MLSNGVYTCPEFEGCFSSFKELESAVFHYEKEHFCSLWRRDSILIDTALKKLKKHRVLNEDLKYYKLKYCCVNGGIQFRKRGDGIRNTQTLKKNCGMHFWIHVNEDGQKLVVKSFSGNHNHPVSQELFESLAQNRLPMLDAQTRKDAETLLLLQVDKKCVQQQLIQHTGVKINLKDLSNVLAAAKRGKTQNSLPDTVALLENKFDINVGMNRSLESFEPSAKRARKDHVQDAKTLVKKTESKLLLDLTSPFNDSDVILKVQGMHIHCHSQILSLSSPVFAAMLSGRFKERAGAAIPLPGKEYISFSELISLMYPAKAGSQLTPNQALYMFPLFHEYNVELWQSKAQDVLVAAVNRKHCVSCLDVALLCGALKLRHKAEEVMAATFSTELVKDVRFSLLNTQVKYEIMLKRVKQLENTASMGSQRSDSIEAAECNGCWRRLGGCAKCKTESNICNTCWTANRRNMINRCRSCNTSLTLCGWCNVDGLQLANDKQCSYCSKHLEQ